MSFPIRLPDTEYTIMQIIWEQEIPTTTAKVAAVAEPLKGWHFKTTQTLLRSNDYLFTSIMNIVSETASGYFSGQITAENAARIIQSRASILASEQFG